MKSINKLSLVLITLFLCASTWAKDTHFYFAQVTDTHIGVSKEYQISDRLDYVVRSINYSALDPEFVVFTGDITNEVLGDRDNIELEKGLALIKQLKIPAYFVPGNHDILHDKKYQMLKAFKDAFGPVPNKAEFDGVVLLFFFIEPLINNYSIQGYEPLEWLEKELKAAGDKPVIIFQHNPFNDDFYLNKLHETGTKDIRDKYVELLNKYNVKAVIAGHYHRDEHHWFGNIPLYVGASVAGEWGRQNTYRVYEYDNGKIGYRTQYLEMK